MRPPQWEYRTIKIDVAGWIGPKVETSVVDATLNAQGAEGWELVSVLDVNAGNGQTTALVAVFKRPR